MRISCSTLEEFFQNLDEGQAFRKVIHAGRVIKTEGIRTDVILQCSAVVLYDDETSALLEAGIYCGRDLDAGDGELDGSVRFDDLRSELVEYAEGKGYRVLPGIIDM